MPTHDEGAPDTAYSNTNGNLKKEIKNDIAGQIGAINDIKRTADSIVTSDNFHLDSKKVNNRWKVEIQFKGGHGKFSYKTVAVVLVEDNATSVVDFRTAVSNALNNGNVWRVS